MFADESEEHATFKERTHANTSDSAVQPPDTTLLSFWYGRWCVLSGQTPLMGDRGLWERALLVMAGNPVVLGVICTTKNTALPIILCPSLSSTHPLYSGFRVFCCCL